MGCARTPRARPARRGPGRRALRRRRPPGSREAKANRPHAGKPWDAPGPLEPDLPDEEPGGGNPGNPGLATLEDAAPASAAAAPMLTNERLINSVAVGL